jgi:hypothetical protein
LHDLIELDGRGIPGVNVITTGFVEAAEAQSDSLGFDPALVVVPHPIQNRTMEEIQRIADEYFEAIVAKIQAH